MDKNDSPAIAASVEDVPHSCDICDDIVHRIIQPKTVGERTNSVQGCVEIEDINVGWMDSISEAKGCALCDFINLIYNQSRDFRVHDQGRVFCFIEGDKQSQLESGQRSMWSLRLSFFYPSQGAADGSIPVTALYQPAFRLLADDAVKGYLNTELGRVLIPSDTDAAFLHTCFRTCINTHGNACGRQVGIFTAGGNEVAMPIGLRVIDTERACVVAIPPGAEYITLSYVWGSTNSLLLTRDTLSQLTRPGYLNTAPVPKTVVDAIQVTRMLGERYLWVDAICILQDDDHEKSTQIQQMDKIYLNGILTIIAAHGRHADAGLWNAASARLRSMQAVVNLGGQRFVSVGPNVEDVLKQSPWAKRAWTYQEYVLSGRLLVYSDCMAYYSCGHGACAEDYVRSVSPNGTQRLEVAEPDDRLQSWPSLEVFQAQNAISDWWCVLRDYSTREMSYESDGLNAIQGVLGCWTRGNQMGFVCGLPVGQLFETGLLWHARKPLRRRLPLSPGRLFPSWSWVGWVGSIEYEYSVVEDHRQLSTSASRRVHEWTLMHEHGVFKSKDLRGSHGQPLAEAITRTLASIQTGVLCFKTRAAFFHVEPEPWNQFVCHARPDPLSQQSGLHRIHSRSQWVGSVALDQAKNENTTVASGSACEFIVLSQGTAIGVDKELSNEETNWTVLFDAGLLDDAARVELDTASGMPMLNVMLIAWEGNVAYREGIGQIHAGLWEAAEWTWKEVRLG